MNWEEITVEGLHVMIQPAWRDQVDHAISHLESQHPGVLTRVAVRFTPIKPHHHGMAVTIDGRVDSKPFHVKREGDNPVNALHQAFAVVLKTLQDRSKRSRHVDGYLSTEMAIEEAILDAESAGRRLKPPRD